MNHPPFIFVASRRCPTVRAGNGKKYKMFVREASRPVMPGWGDGSSFFEEGVDEELQVLSNLLTREEADAREAHGLLGDNDLVLIHEVCPGPDLDFDSIVQDEISLRLVGHRGAVLSG